MPPESSFDLKANHPLLPHPEVTRLYKENDFKYTKEIEDRNYEDWYDEVKRGKVTILITQFFRNSVNKKDYIYYDAMLFGTDRKGNRSPFTIRMGVYEKPTFRMDLDSRTDKVLSNQILEKRKVYDIQYSPQLFDNLLEQATEDNLNMQVVTPGKNYTIHDVTAFRDATYPELVEIGKTGRSLHAIRVETTPTTTTPTPKAKAAAASTTTK